ncbi:MAG: hypothetical protein AB7K24_13720 [Gemmataceae bacterium]
MPFSVDGFFVNAIYWYLVVMVLYVAPGLVIWASLWAARCLLRQERARRL